jgi:DNA-binding SARP family transcriptional activator
VLGAPRVLLDGQEIELARHKSLALLVYLAVTGGRHRRDALAALLWPELDQARARAGVRAALWALNAALPGPWWAVQRETVGLEPGTEVWLDLAEFRCNLAACRSHGHSADETCTDCLAPLARAVELSCGDFLAGFGLRDAPAFDEWQLAQAEAARYELAGALEKLTRLHISQVQFTPAATYARRWLILDPLHEPAHQSLMRLYAWSGQRSAALRQYAECARVLEAELGVAPQTETQALYQAILDNRLPPPQPGTSVRGGAEPRAGPSPVAAQRPRVAGHRQPAAGAGGSILDRIRQAPLVGRAGELEIAATLWGRAQFGEGQVLLVSGEPGIGKSRLVRELRSLAEAAGARVLTGECHAEGGPPYGALAQMIGTALSDPASGPALPDYVLADLLLLAPHLRPRFRSIVPNPALDPSFEQQRLLDSAVTWCKALAAQSPLLLVVEDVHWADSGTLSIMRHLARHLRTSRLMLVMTYRDTEVELAEAQSLSEVLLDLNRERLAQPLRLGRLNRGQTEDLLAALLATGEVSEPFIDSVFEETEGNPFFVEELCKALIDQGQLYLAGSTWRRKDLKTVVLPRSVRAAILLRVERLPAPVQAMLRLAAVLGREFEFETLSAASDQETEAVLTALEQAERAQLLHENRSGPAGPGGRFTFAHALIPFTLRETLSGLRLQRLHARVASAIEARRPEDVEALAYHYTAAGQRESAIRYLRRSADRAVAVYAYETAIQHVRTALSLMDAGRPDAARIEVAEQLANLHRRRGERADAIALYHEALGALRQMAQPDRWTEVRLHRKLVEAFHGTWSHDEWERFRPMARASLQQAVALVADQPPHLETVRLYTTLTQDAYWNVALALAENSPADDGAEVQRYAQAAVEMAEQLGAPVELSAALSALATAYGVRGLHRERVELARRRLALSRGPGFTDARDQVNLLCEFGLALLVVGEFTEALPHLLEAERRAGQVRDVSQQVYALLLQAQCYFGLDRWDEMLAIAARHRALEDEYGRERVDRMCYYCGISANVLGWRGEQVEARAARQQAYDLMAHAFGGPPDCWSPAGHY